MTPTALELHSAAVTECRRCPRLVAWRERVASDKRAAFRNEDYWGKPVPGFGDPRARLVIVGLAPAAHGANRTGRMFTGDRSGDWLYRALFRAGFASQAEATARDDGMELRDTWITAAVRCAPPANKPTPVERDTCADWLAAELELLPRRKVFLCLGAFGYQALWRQLAASGCSLPRPRPPFTHGVEVTLSGSRYVLGSFHPSQQNTFTGKLTEEMLDETMARARSLVAG